MEGARNSDCLSSHNSGSMGGMLPDAFQTPRLLFCPIGMSDAVSIFDSYVEDPEVSRYLTWRPHADLQQTGAYVQACL